MTEDLQNRVKAFRTAMSVVKEMLKSGVISEDDYEAIESIVAKNMGVFSSTIYR